MILPGPEAQQLATYIGWLMHGVPGALTAGILFILPGLLTLAGLSIAYVSFGSLPAVAAIFLGLKPAVIAIIVVALLRIGSRSLKSAYHYAVAALSFILIFFFQVSFPLIVVGAIILGWILSRYLPRLYEQRGSSTSEENEDEFVINARSKSVIVLSVKNALLKAGVGLILWIIPLLLFITWSTDTLFWQNLIEFFTKAALVTFGGAYAVLPYVAQVSVEKFHWLSSLQMIDGMALGETTPGPLIIILVFVGFMAGYNHFDGSVLAGSIGLFTTAYYTFLPSFLFILIGAPWVEKTKDNESLKRILSIVTAAVVGVILNLTIYFGRHVLFTKEFEVEYFALAWCVVSLIALYKFKVNMVLWIFISGMAGILYGYVSGVI
jgi:chromate transporter